MDRIWEFVRRAKSGVSAEGATEGHLPSEEHVDGLTAKVSSLQLYHHNSFDCLHLLQSQ